MDKFESYSAFLTKVIALALVALVAGCGGGQDSILGSGGIGNSGVVAPTVTATVPLASTPIVTGVAINTKITATFSKDMASATITTSTFTLACPTGTPVTGTVAYVAASRVATFSPAANLPINTTCTATITTGARDTTGRALATAFVWRFTTAAAADTTRPRVTLTVPADGAAGVATNTQIIATFIEDIDPATISATTFTLTGPGATAVTGAVTYAVGARTATFTPTATLPISTVFTATITTGATDLAGNALAGNQAALPAASNFIWTFTTGAGPDNTPPTVTLLNPTDLATGVCLETRVNATFSEAMVPSTLTNTTVTLQLTGPPLGALLGGNVVYDVQNNVATFTPTSALAANTNYTATVTTGAQDLAGNALASNRVWSFTTGTQSCFPLPPSLGLAAPFAIAANAGVTNTPNVPITTINGNVVLDPVTAATCNAVPIDAAGGFGLCAGSPPAINGQVISPLFPDAGATSGAIISDLQAAFLSITPPAGPPAAGSLGGATPIPAGTTLGEPTGSALVQGDNLFRPGVYQSLTSILITGDLTLDAQGDPNALFIFQSSSTVGTAAGAASPAPHTRILLINGAKASNVWWQAGSSATLGLFSEFQGNILASADITMTTGATSCGRLLAGGFTSGAFVFDSNVVSVPGNVNAPPTCN